MREIDVERGAWVEEVKRLRSRVELAERKKEIKHRLPTRKFEREQVQITNRNPRSNPYAIPKPDRMVVSVPFLGHV